MNQDQLIQKLSNILDPKRVKLKEKMSAHTTFRIGGEADVMVAPATVEELKAILALLYQERLPYFVLGNGSNILVGDEGIREVVIQLGDAFAAYECMGVYLYAQSGIKLSRLAGLAYAQGLTGLEFAAGIPGTLGGAIYMNAGAYGGEMAQVIEAVTYLDEKGEEHTVSGKECGFGYRTSIFAQQKNLTVIGCMVKLSPGDKDAIHDTMADLAERRKEKQPLNFPSAGSTFKRPEGYFAGKLIQDAGLMGFRVGGACVSEKHAGFVVNDKQATAKDVRVLMEKVQEKVQDEFGVTLEPEVKFVGEF